MTMRALRDVWLQERVILYKNNPMLKDMLLSFPGGKKNKRNVEMFDKYLTTTATLETIAEKNNITRERVRQIIRKYARIAERKYKWSILKLN